MVRHWVVWRSGSPMQRREVPGREKRAASSVVCPCAKSALDHVAICMSLLVTRHQECVAFFQPLRYGDFLWTFLFTFKAFSTFVSPFFFRRYHPIPKTRYGWIIVHHRIIVLSKYMGNVHTAGTRHTIGTSGAGNRAEFSVLLRHFLDG